MEDVKQKEITLWNGYLYNTVPCSLIKINNKIQWKVEWDYKDGTSYRPFEYFIYNYNRNNITGESIPTEIGIAILNFPEVKKKRDKAKNILWSGTQRCNGSVHHNCRFIKRNNELIFEEDIEYITIEYSLEEYIKDCRQNAMYDNPLPINIINAIKSTKGYKDHG